MPEGKVFRGRVRIGSKNYSLNELPAQIIPSDTVESRICHYSENYYNIMKNHCNIVKIITI